MFQKKIKSTWTYEGIIYIRQNNDTRIKIEHISELEEHFPELVT